jgi:hypothetical protein
MHRREAIVGTGSEQFFEHPAWRDQLFLRFAEASNRYQPGTGSGEITLLIRRSANCRGQLLNRPLATAVLLKGCVISAEIPAGEQPPKVCEDGISVKAASKRKEKRQSFRRRIEIPCLVTVLDQSALTATGLILDVSREGIAALLSSPIDVDTLISIKHESATLIGEVRNCIHTPEGFRLGIELLGRD